MAYELGTTIVLVRAGAVPPEDEPARREVFTSALRDLGIRAEHRGVRLALETGSEPAERSGHFSISLGLARPRRQHRSRQRVCRPASTRSHRCASSPRGSCTRMPTMPIRSSGAAPNPRGSGFPPGALDWEEYLGASEEIGYQGFLTIWPAPDRPVAAQYGAIARYLEQLG